MLNQEIAVLKQKGEDYISLTDMLKAKDGEFCISDWLRNRNTIEFLGIWEHLNNPAFNPIEFDGLKSQAGLNTFILTVKSWVATIEAVAIQQMKIFVNDTMTIVDLSLGGIRQSKVKVKRRGDKLKDIHGQ